MMEEMDHKRKSLDLSSLEDIPEERAGTGAEDGNRLDSGLGEWESGSSRKTSISSEGSRYSPDDTGAIKSSTNTKLRDQKPAKSRRRSGYDMIQNRPLRVSASSGTQNGNDPVPQVVFAALPRIPRTSRSSGMWSRKISPAGIEYLKMDDEMEEVQRNGKLVMVPRKISDHIPVVPIHSTDRFFRDEYNENLGLEDEDLQIYKVPHTDVYLLHRHRWEFFGKRDFRKTMLLALDGNQWMSGQQKFELMKTMLSEKDQRKMEKMLKMGYSHDDVVNHFMDEADKKSGNNSLRKQMEAAMAANSMNEEAAMEEMKKQLGEQSVKEMEKLLKEGHSPQEVMKKMMDLGLTKDEEAAESVETLQHLMKSKKKNIKLNKSEAAAIVDERFDEESKIKLKKLMDSGKSLQEALNQVLEETKPPGEQLTEMEKKMQQLTGDQELSQYQIYEMLKEQLDEESARKMEEMVKNGCPLDEAIQHFMKKGKTKEQAANESSEKLRKMMADGAMKDMTPEEIIERMKSELGQADCKQLEKMLASGCSLQEVIDHFMHRGEEDIESEVLGKTEFQVKMEALLQGKNLKDEEILALMRGQLDEKGKEEIREMLEKGYSPRDIINHMFKNTKTEDEIKRENSEKLARMFDDNNITEEEKIAMLEKQLNNQDKEQMEAMLAKGCSIEEVIAHFMTRSKSPPREKSEFAKTIEHLVDGRSLSPDEMLSLIEENLDKESREKMQEMLAKGYSKQDVIDHFMRNAKTKDEQMKETAERIKALMSDDTMTEKDKLEILRNQLSKEDLAQMELLLKDGGTVDDVMNQILKSKSTESLSSNYETELSKVVNQLIDGRQLGKEEILDIIRGQVDEESKKRLDSMLQGGMALQEVIDHFMANGRTIREAHKEVSERLKALLVTEEAVHSSAQKQIEIIRRVLDPSDAAQMEFLLTHGCSPEEVVAHFTNRCVQDSEPTSQLAARLKKLSGGKPLPADQMLELLRGQLGAEGIQTLDEMLAKGYTPHDVLNHLLETGMTKEEEETSRCQSAEVGRKMSQLLSSMGQMTEEQMLEVVSSQLSSEDNKLMQEMLRQGKSLKEVLEHFVDRGAKCAPKTEQQILSEKIKKLSCGRKLSNEEMLELIKENLSESDKAEMERLMKSGVATQDIIARFAGSETAEACRHKELSLKLETLIDTSSMNDEEILSILNAHLNPSDKKEMEFMLQQGCSLEEVVAYFKCRGLEEESGTEAAAGQANELARRVKKLSHGKQLTDEQMCQLIKDQLSPEGKAEMDKLLSQGMGMREVIEYFMSHGKTELEEQRDIAQRLGQLVQKRKLSREEVKQLLDNELPPSDRAKMEEMLLHGCTIEEILQHFLLRGVPPEQGTTKIAARVKKLSRTKGLSKQEIIEIIRMQLTEESQDMLEQMLMKGYNQDDVITHFMIKGRTWQEEFHDTAQKISKVMDGKKDLTEAEIIEVLKQNMGSFDQAQVDEMMRRGCTTPEILTLFLNRGSSSGLKTEFILKIQSLLEGKIMHPIDLLEVIQKYADDETNEKIEEMLKKGYAIQDAIEYAYIHGKTQEQKLREVADKMLQLLASDMKEEDVIAIMKKQLGKTGSQILEDMLASGCSLAEVLEKLLDGSATGEGGSEVEEETEFAKKIKEMMGDRVLNAEEMIALIRSQLDMPTQLQMDEMLRNGCTKDEVIQHFMTRERNKKGQKKNEFGRKIFELTRGTKLTKREIILLMKNHLDEESAAKMEEMIKKCYPMDDIIDYFLKNGKTPEQALREKTLAKERQKKEASRKIRKMISGNKLSNEEILAILRLQMGADDREQLEIMLKRGCTAEEIIQHFVNRDNSDDEDGGHETTMFEKKMAELMDGKDLSKDEILDLMKSELDEESVQQMEAMLLKGYTKDDVIKYFMKHGDDRNEFVQEMKKLMSSGEPMSKEQILEAMREKLGVLDQRKMDDMLREGHSAESIIQHLMTHGKTQDQETKLFTRRMSILLNDKDNSKLTDEEKVEMLKDNLGKEAASMLEELLKNGLTSSHVLDLFLKHGNNVNSLVKDDFFFRELLFPDEPEDAEHHKSRDVFSVINQAEAKAFLPWMSPSGKTHIFGLFFEKVLELIDGKGLTHREIMNLMRSRMGAGYAKEFDEQRNKGMRLQQIVDYFLRRDAETIAESRLVAKLKADARVDSRVYLKRRYSKERWGVSITYTYSKNHGLHLIFNDVVENGPAWESGIRAGDVIVTINDWLIVLMDRPQVAAHLFQAGANIVKLGIQKTRGTSPDRFLGVY